MLSNQKLGDHVAKAITEVRQDEGKKPAEMAEGVSERMGEKAYSKKGRLIFLKGRHEKVILERLSLIFRKNERTGI